MPCSGRTQRRLSVDGRRLAPAHRLGPGEGADDRRDRLGEHVGGRAAGLVDHREAARRRASSSWSRVRPVLRRKPSSACGGRIGARALQFLADRRGFERQVARDQREAARRGVGDDRLGVEARPCRARRRTAARDRRAPWPASARGFPRSGVRAGNRSCAPLPREGGSISAACARKFGRVASRPRNGAEWHHAAHPFFSIHASQLPFARSRTRPI